MDFAARWNQMTDKDREIVLSKLVTPGSANQLSQYPWSYFAGTLLQAELRDLIKTWER